MKVTGTVAAAIISKFIIVVCFTKFVNCFNSVPLHRSAWIQQRQTSCLDGLQLTKKMSWIPTVGTIILIMNCDDGCLMLCCKRQGEGCHIWYHYDCLGLTKEESQQIGTFGEDFICPSCSHLAQDNLHYAPFIADSPGVLDPCTDFQWDEISGQQFCDFILSTYEEVVHWRNNNYLVPYGKAEKSFVCVLARLYQAFVKGSVLHYIALMACSVMQLLLL